MFWKYAANKTNVRTMVPNLYLTNEESPNDMTSNDREEAQKLSNLFASVLTNKVEGVWELANKPEIKHKLAILIDEEVVSKILVKLKVTKSPGPDQMHSSILHEIRSILVTPLTLKFQTSLRTGVLPAAWKKANITAIHKKGSMQFSMRLATTAELAWPVSYVRSWNPLSGMPLSNIWKTTFHLLIDNLASWVVVPPLSNYWTSSMTGLRSWIETAVWMWCTVTSWKPLTLFHMAASFRSSSITGLIVCSWGGSGGSWLTGNNV